MRRLLFFNGIKAFEPAARSGSFEPLVAAEPITRNQAGRHAG